MKDFLWWRDGIIYQIYPRSFYDTTGSGIGDLNGITAKLDYLEDLGVDALWLSPINPSPDRDFGYDVSDYFSIDPKFGSMADFMRLITSAARRGIRIIMDLVLNHTSDQHPWFLESRASRDNPKRDWYIWRDGRGKGRPPNNWLSVFGGSAWQWDKASGQFYLHMFYKEQPDLNWRNPEVRRELLDVFRFWLDKGVKGFRLDVFNLYYKDAEFWDNPIRPFRLRPDQRQKMIHNCDLPDMKDVLAEIRKLLDQYDDAYVVGETFLGSPVKAAGYCGDNALHQAFLFDFLECRWNPVHFSKAIEEWEAALEETNWPNYVLNNHDVVRSASRYGQREDDERLKVAAALLLTLRGTPFLYYGEEIGMREVKLSRSQILDPVGKRFWPVYKGRDGCRTPMQWSSGMNAGFSSGSPWLPRHPDWPERNVENQETNPDSLFNFYQRLIALRRSEAVLVRGSFEFIKNMPSGIMAYHRELKEQCAWIYLNFCHKIQQISVPEVNIRRIISSQRESLPAGKTIDLLGNEALILISA